MSVTVYESCLSKHNVSHEFCILYRVILHNVAILGNTAVVLGQDWLHSWLRGFQCSCYFLHFIFFSIKQSQNAAHFILGVNMQLMLVMLLPQHLMPGLQARNTTPTLTAFIM